MKQGKEIDNKVAETLNSLDGIERATPGHFFFTRLQARLNRGEADIWEKLSSFLARPVFVIASIIFIIALNIIVVYREIPQAPSFVDQSEQAFDDEYNIGVAGIYEYEKSGTLMTANSKNKLFILTIAILLLANIAMLVFFVWLKEPQEKERRHQKGRNPVSELLEQKIGFDKQQMSQYEQMKQLHKEKMKPLFEDLRMAKEEFYSQLNNLPISDSALNAASEMIGEKQRLLDVQIFNHFRSLRNLCTAEQRPSFDTLIQGILHKMVIAGRHGVQSRKDTIIKQD